MTWLLPHPVVSAVLLMLWLLLNVTASPGHLLLGSAVALAGGWALHALRPPPAQVSRPGAILRLAALVIADIVRSNVAVARIVLRVGARAQQSGFVDIPLDLRDPYGLAVLACIITSTPGTLWVKHEPRTGMLTIHVLDLVDESAWIETIKGRYEHLLLEIFE